MDPDRIELESVFDFCKKKGIIGCGWLYNKRVNDKMKLIYKFIIKLFFIIINL